MRRTRARPEQPLVRHHHARRREARDADFDRPATQDHARGKEIFTAVVCYVRRDIAKRRLAGGTTQEIDAKVKIVIAGRDGIVLQHVQRIDDRLRLALVVPSVIDGERIALQQVARIHEDDLAGIAGAQCLERSRGPRQAAGRRGIPDVVPPEYPAVDVGGRDDDDVGGIEGGSSLKRDQ